jgi:hypothetical protein
VCPSPCAVDIFHSPHRWPCPASTASLRLILLSFFDLQRASRRSTAPSAMCNIDQTHGSSNGTMQTLHEIVFVSLAAPRRTYVDCKAFEAVTCLFGT